VWLESDFVINVPLDERTNLASIERNLVDGALFWNPSNEFIHTSAYITQFDITAIIRIERKVLFCSQPLITNTVRSPVADWFSNTNLAIS
jgi:hypothetical protein